MSIYVRISTPPIFYKMKEISFYRTLTLFQVPLKMWQMLHNHFKRKTLLSVLLLCILGGTTTFLFSSSNAADSTTLPGIVSYMENLFYNKFTVETEYSNNVNMRVKFNY